MIERALTATNAAKAVVAILLNAAIEFVEAFGIYDLSDPQENALSGAINGALLVYLLLTYRLSSKRVADA